MPQLTPGIRTAAPLTAVAVRLGPGEEVKAALLRTAAAHELSAAWVLTCVGSVTQARIRLAAHGSDVSDGSNDFMDLVGPHEIVSAVGTLTGNGEGHVHISVADATGRVVGGHLVSATVFTTAEVVIQGTQRDRSDGFHFSRSLDTRTGFKELVVTPQWVE